jgi:N-acetylglucosamine kinase-like BadF-type ATPase
VDALLHRLDVREPAELIGVVYRIADDRAQIALLADVVTHTADQGDAVAQQILDEAAGELASMVAAVARKLDFASEAFPLAVTGGVLLASDGLRSRLETGLNSCGLAPAAITQVADPVLGAVRLAQSDAAGEGTVD